MAPTFPSLLQPLKIGDLELQNRVAMTAMTRARSSTKTKEANNLMQEYYIQRAKAGLIVCEGVAPSPQGYGWVDTTGIYTQAQADSWKKVVDAVHDKGGKIFCQLWHTGRQSHSSYQEDGILPVAASAIKVEGKETHAADGSKQAYEVPRALETDEIPGVIQDHKKAAQLAKDAGFDGIELHCANGYLFNSFLESKTNQRTDQYGGSLENRFRIVDEALKALSEVYPSTRIGVKISPNGVFGDMGSADNHEAFTYYLTKLNDYNLGYLCIMNGLGFGYHNLSPVVDLEHVRKHYKGTVMANCGYTPQQAEEDVQKGLADLVGFGRLYITNPDLVERLQQGQEMNETVDPSTWFSKGGTEVGYTTYPVYSEWKAQQEKVAA